MKLELKLLLLISVILLLIHLMMAGAAELPVIREPQTIVVCSDPIKLYVRDTYEAIHPISPSASYAYAYVVYASPLSTP